jgi:hypothetical protein
MFGLEQISLLQARCRLGWFFSWPALESGLARGVGHLREEPSSLGPKYQGLAGAGVQSFLRGELLTGDRRGAESVIPVTLLETGHVGKKTLPTIIKCLHRWRVPVRHGTRHPRRDTKYNFRGLSRSLQLSCYLGRS